MIGIELRVDGLGDSAPGTGRRGRPRGRSPSVSLALLPAAALALGLLAGAVGCGGGGASGYDAGVPADAGAQDTVVPDDDGSPGEDAGIVSMPVVASQNVLALDSCQVTPAEIPDVPAGTYTIRLDASTLSKGYDSATPPNASVDNYVVVHLPLGAGDPQQDHRFFMLNGIGASYTFTLATPGTIQVMFIDSDNSYNTGQATVSVSPGGYSTTVDATANVLSWQTGCGATPATTAVNPGSHDSSLLASTLSSGPNLVDDFVLLRFPTEVQRDDFRYVILNGVGASQVFETPNGGNVRAWFITAGAGATGQATVGTSGP